MTRQPRQKLSLAELLVVLALVGIALGLARRWWDAWQTEEWAFAVAWTAAWIVGVGGGRAIFRRAVLPASLLCAATTFAVALYFRVSWHALLIVVAAAFLAALSTAALPWMIVRGGSWATMMITGKSSVSWKSLLGIAVVLIAAMGAAAVLWLRTPPVSTTVIRQFEKSRGSEDEKRGLRCVSSGGRFVALSSDRGIEVFDLESQAIRRVPNSSRLEVVSISPRGDRLGCFLRDEELGRAATAYCIDAASGARLVDFRIRFPGPILSFADDKTFLVGDLDDDGLRLQVERWRLEPAVELAERWQFDCPKGGDIGAQTKDGRYAVVDYDDGGSPYSSIVRWQIWKVTPPAELIMDSIDKEFPHGRPGFLANGEWFTGTHRV